VAVNQVLLLTCATRFFLLLTHRLQCQKLGASQSMIHDTIHDTQAARQQSLFDPHVEVRLALLQLLNQSPLRSKDSSSHETQRGS